MVEEEEIAGVEVREEEEVTGEGQVEEASPETRQAAVETTLKVAGQEFSVILTNLHSPVVKNISVTGKVLIGVRNLLHALGKTILRQETIENLTSLNLIDKCKIYCIMIPTRKYMRL